MARSQFAKVIFHMERDMFPVGRDVECPLEITESLEANKWDWIGLFPVGWRSQKDYITYEYVPLPSDYQNGKKALSNVTFSASNLPKDDEFYQFCYVSHRLSNICGASVPFQFRTSSGKEYVEEECDDMMVIRDKKDVMKEEIQKLSHKLLLLTKERDALQEKTQALEKTMSDKDYMISQLNMQVSSLKMLGELEKDTVDKMKMEIAQYQANVKILTMEKETVEANMHGLSTKMEEVLDQITSLKATIRSLESERDELNGKNQSLVDEVDSYKMEVLQSQTTATQNRKTINKLNESLEMAYNQSATAVEECEQLKKQAAEREDILRHKDERLAQLLQYKVDMERKREELNYELVNANDKLLACDTVKAKLSSELEAYEQTQAQMTSRFEHQESELRCMQDQLEQKSKECGDLKKKLAAKDKDVEDKTKELIRTQSVLNQTLQDAEAQSTHVKHNAQKLASTERERAETRKQLDIVTTQLKNISDEKIALQMQLRTFEEELQGTLVMKDKEVIGRLEELKEKTLIVEERDQEIARKQKEVLRLTEEVHSLEEQLECQKKLLEKEVEEFRISQRNLQDMELRVQDFTEKVAQLQLERDAHLEKYKEIEATLQEREAKWQEDEAARYCLWKANEALKARIDERDREMDNMMRRIDDLEASLKAERQAKDEKELEVVDLKHRLELGKLEYQNKVLEHQKQVRRMEKDAGQKASKSDNCSSMDASLSSSVSDTEAADEKRRKKYKPMYKALKQEKESLLKSLESKHQELQKVVEDHEGTRRHAETLSVMIDELKASLEQKQEYIQQLESEINSLKSKAEEEEMAARKKLESARRQLEEDALYAPDDTVEQPEEMDEPYTPNTEDKMEDKRRRFIVRMPSEGSDEEQQSRFILVYGNPYNSSVEPAAQPPKQRVIIRSTLEEEEEPEEQQLPPPLEPEVVCAQGLAACSDVDDSAAEEGGEGGQEIFEDCSAAIPANDDGFLDAIGEGMKICPFCQASVMATSDFEEHVATHFGRICPVCQRQADDNMSSHDFEQHVNKCLDQDSASAPPKEEEETDNCE